MNHARMVLDLSILIAIIAAIYYLKVQSTGSAIGPADLIHNWFGGN